MDRLMKRITFCAAVCLMQALAWAEEPPPPPEAPAAPAVAEDGKSKIFSVQIGAHGAEEDGKGHGITISVDGDGDEQSRKIEIAGKVVERVVTELEKALAEMPEDIRAELDEDDMRDLQQALTEIEQLKRGSDRHVVKKVMRDDSFDEDVIPGVLAILLLFGGPVVIVAIVSFNNRRKREMVHQTIDKIIEQGRDVPVELLEGLDKGKNNGKSMLARGTVNVALGLGIGGALWALSGPDVATLGLIPLCIGAAQLFNWKLEGKRESTV